MLKQGFRKGSAMEVDGPRLSIGAATHSSENKDSSIKTIGKSFKAPNLQNLEQMRNLRDARKSTKNSQASSNEQQVLFLGNSD